MEELPLLIECARDGDVEAYGRVVRRFQDMASPKTTSISSRTRRPEGWSNRICSKWSGALIH